ncbi:Uncharacterised protein [Mycobacterium tuberculosis]|nr:Uncharacterised protein [Mycobacterium tuberculosis]
MLVARVREESSSACATRRLFSSAGLVARGSGVAGVQDSVMVSRFYACRM